MTDRKYDGRHTAGDLPPNSITGEVPVGPCPSCGAILLVAQIVDPRSGLPARALAHPMPFCHYYGATTPEQIEADMLAGKEVH